MVKIQTTNSSSIKWRLWYYGMLMAIILIPINFFGLLIGPLTLIIAGIPASGVLFLGLMYIKPKQLMGRIYILSKRGDFFWYGVLLSIVVNIIIIAYSYDYIVVNAQYINTKGNQFIRNQSIVSNAIIFNLAHYVYLKEILRDQAINKLRDIALENGKVRFHYYPLFKFIEEIFQKDRKNRLPNNSDNQLLDRFLNDFEIRNKFSISRSN